MKIVVIICIILLLVIGYGILTWLVYRRDNPMFNIPDEVRVVNLGSTYAYYALNYKSVGVSGVNFANRPQYANYDIILLNKYISRLPKGCKHLFCFPDFYFACNQMKPLQRVYYESLLPWEMSGYSVSRFLKYFIESMHQPFTHSLKKPNIKDKVLTTKEEMLKLAESRVWGWENRESTKIPSVKSSEITLELQQRLDMNISYVLKMVEICRKHEVEPFFLLFPESEIMSNLISEDCLETYLYEPVRKLVNLTGVRLLDYSHDRDFYDMSLYRNCDCLNEKGSRLFTEKVMKDIGVLK